tara:strand:+ start:208 stop:348 length:141 start_codon:yes stop_codon:yes gene_type:complete
LTGEIEAFVTYAILATMLGFYSFRRISSLIELKIAIQGKQTADSEE